MLTETLSCSAYLLFTLPRTSRHFLFLRFLDRHYLTTRPNSAKARIYISTKARSDGNMRRCIYILLTRNLEDASVARSDGNMRRCIYILLTRNLEDASVTRARVLCPLCSSLPVYFRLHMYNFLPVGHTHEDIDALFVCFSKCLKFKDVYTVDGKFIAGSFGNYIL